MKSTYQISDSILHFVKDNPGCSATQICNGVIGSDEDYYVDLPVLLEDLVDGGKLIEVEYILENCPHKMQSAYFSMDFPIQDCSKKFLSDSKSIVIYQHSNAVYSLNRF